MKGQNKNESVVCNLVDLFTLTNKAKTFCFQCFKGQS